MRILISVAGSWELVDLSYHVQSCPIASGPQRERLRGNGSSWMSLTRHKTPVWHTVNRPPRGNPMRGHPVINGHILGTVPYLCHVKEPAFKGHMSCRETFSDMQVSLEDRLYCTSPDCDPTRQIVTSLPWYSIGQCIWWRFQICHKRPRGPGLSGGIKGIEKHWSTPMLARSPLCTGLHADIRSTRPRHCATASN